MDYDANIKMMEEDEELKEFFFPLNDHRLKVITEVINKLNSIFAEH